jgi:hypothetical protein
VGATAFGPAGEPDGVVAIPIVGGLTRLDHDQHVEGTKSAEVTTRPRL